MNKKVNIPQGYKDTPVGIIPEDWDVKRLGEISDVYSGGTPKTSVSTFYNGDIPFIKSGEIKQNFTEQTLTDIGVQNSSAKIIEVGDLLYALYGANSGDCSISKIKGAINQAILCIRPKADKYFLCSILELNKNYYYNKFLQGGQGNLSAEIVKSYNVALPPLPEQQKIAEILNLWDKAIEKQSELISQLELRKKGLMQQLLTGKKRLPGFDGKWIAKKMQDICILKSNFAISREQMNYSEGNICSIHYGDVLIRYPNILDIEKESIPYINKEISRNISFKDFIEEGDIIMSDTAEDETVGRACEIINLNNRKLTAGLHTFLIHPQIKFAKAFLGYYLNSNRYRQQIIPLIQGIKVSSITKKSLLSTYIEIPSIEEQNAIANILMQADEEIENIQKKLEYLRTQKRGLMQQLLTGKIRVN